MKQIFFAFSIMCASSSQAQFFDDPIKYFDNAELEKAEARAPAKASPEADESPKFKWDNYLDESKDEFFREGDYIPPAPFLEVVRRPTSKNILLFEKWKEKKNQLLKRYNDKRVAVLGVKGLSLPTEEKSAVATDVYEKLKEYRMVFYFSSTCPACKQMYPVINELVENGVYVEAVRLDPGGNAVNGLRIPWLPASPKEVAAFKITATPTLMIFEDRSRQVFKVVQKRSAEEILSIIQRVKKT